MESVRLKGTWFGQKMELGPATRIEPDPGCGKSVCQDDNQLPLVSCQIE
jgi:hypothetical protein